MTGELFSAARGSPKPLLHAPHLTAPVRHATPVRRSHRILDNLRAEAQRWVLEDEQPVEPTSAETVALVHDILEGRKRIRQAVKRTREVYESQMRHAEYLERRKEELSQLQADFRQHARELADLRRQAADAGIDGSQSLSAMTPEQRVLDARLTDLEHMHWMMQERLADETRSQDSTVEGYMATERCMRETLASETAFRTELNAKRRRLTEKLCDATSDDVEFCIDRAVAEATTEAEQAYRATVDAMRAELTVLKRERDEHQCALCCDRLTNAVVTCCSHGVCTACVESLFNSQDSERCACPFCRRPIAANQVIRVAH